MQSNVQGVNASVWNHTAGSGMFEEGRRVSCRGLDRRTAVFMVCGMLTAACAWGKTTRVVALVETLQTPWAPQAAKSEFKEMGFGVGLRTLWIRATVTITIPKASAVVPSSCTHQRASAQSVALCHRVSIIPAAAITSCQTCKIDWRGARGGG